MKIWDRFRKKPEPIVEAPKREKPRPIFSTDDFGETDSAVRLEQLNERMFKNSIHPELKKTLDAATKAPQANFATDSSPSVKSSFYGNEIIPQGQLLWYANQTFIGYQLCAMLAQQWLVSKCCLMPAEDATRKGFDITVNDGNEIGADILDEMRKRDRQI